MNASAISGRVTRACQRRLARWFGRRPVAVAPRHPIVSFTFDDFPRSALFTAGRVLQERGFAGTYYTSLGLAGTTTATGEMFQRRDLEWLVAQGHELGCHTFTHSPAWETKPEQFEADVVKNAAVLPSVVPNTAFRTLSYPISYPRPGTKRRLSKYFACCRGGGQTFNAGPSDLNYLSAYFLEQAGGSTAAVEALISATCTANGWLILATHDVAARPTRYGCTPGFFEAVVDLVARSGATVLPVTAALAVVTKDTARRGAERPGIVGC